MINKIFIKSITLKNIKISPTKLNIYILKLRNKTYIELLKLFKYSHNKYDIIIWKLIYSLISNLKMTINLNLKNLIIFEIFVTRGPILKRLQPRAKGQSVQIQKKFSNLTISLGKKI